MHFWGQWQKPILIWVKINAVIPLKKSAKQFSHEQFTAQTCQSICVWNSWHVVLQTSPYQGLNTISTFPDYRAAAEDYVNYHVPMWEEEAENHGGYQSSSTIHTTLLHTGNKLLIRLIVIIDIALRDDFYRLTFVKPVNRRFAFLSSCWDQVFMKFLNS